MVEHQGPRRRAVCQIKVGGRDITTVLKPHLISVQVIDNYVEHDQCNIELDDRNATLQIPPDGETLEVLIGWAGEGPRLPDWGRFSTDKKGNRTIGQGPIQMTDIELALEKEFGGPGIELLFSGTVSNVESGFGRKGGGRRLWIEGTSGNNKDAAKEAVNSTFGEGKADDSVGSDGGAAASPASGSGGAAGGGGGGGGSGSIPLHEVLTKAFGKIGIPFKASPEMMKVARDFWHIGNQSPIDFASAYARDNGAIFKMAGGTAVMIAKGEGVNVDGLVMPTVEAIWGINLIGWRIKPYAGRPQWAKASARFFDLFQGSHQAVTSAISGGTPFGGAKAVAHYINQVADKGVGQEANTGAEQDSKFRRGTGWILLNGEPRAHAGGYIYIDYARPGVDGTYLMVECEHMYQRGVGYTTRCNVQYPSPKVGDYTFDNDPGVPPAGSEEKEPPPKTDEFMPPIEYLVPGFSPKELSIMRKWYLDRNLMLPDVLAIPEEGKAAWREFYTKQGKNIPKYLQTEEERQNIQTP
jgi:hypothetical protein